MRFDPLPGRCPALQGRLVANEKLTATGGPGLQRLALLPMLLSLVLVAAVSAQDSAPDSRGERWTFRQIEGPIVVEGQQVLVRASDGRDTIVITKDGAVHYDVDKSLFQPREHWTAQLPPGTLRGIESAVAAAAASGRSLEVADLLKLVRMTREARRKPARGMVGELDLWQERHQEADGSWSPTRFDSFCESDQRCDGFGKESFRVAASALLSVGYVSLLSRSLSDDDRNEPAKRALGFIVARQVADGGFAAADDPYPAMTNACAAIALGRAVVRATRYGSHESSAIAKSGSRSWQLGSVTESARAALSRVRAGQSSDGSFGSSLDAARQLSTTAWSLLALKAGEMEGDPAASSRAAAWIEKTVAAIEARPAGAVSPENLSRARAIRALARAATGSDSAADVRAVIASFEKDGDAAHDGETILFTTLAAFRRGSDHWEAWVRVIHKPVIEMRERGGCTADSSTVPCIWSDSGGRLVSTALMLWVTEIYYRYPYAFLLE